MDAANSTSKTGKPFPKLTTLDFLVFFTCFSLLFAFHTAIASKTPNDWFRHPELRNHMGGIYGLRFGFAIGALITYCRHRFRGKLEFSAGVYLALICGCVAVLEITGQAWAFAVGATGAETAVSDYILKLAIPLVSLIILAFAIFRVGAVWRFAFLCLAVYFAILALQGFWIINSLMDFLKPYVGYYSVLVLGLKVSVLLACFSILFAVIVDGVSGTKSTWFHHLGWLLMINLIAITPVLYWLTGKLLWPD